MGIVSGLGEVIPKKTKLKKKAPRKVPLNTATMLFSHQWKTTIMPPKKLEIPDALWGDSDWVKEVQLPNQNTETIGYDFDAWYIAKIDWDLDDIVLVFYVDKNQDIYNFFKDWNGLKAGKKQNLMAYFEDYVGDIIKVLNNRKYEFKNAFPISITEITLSGEEVAIKEFSVTFTYTDLNITKKT